MLNILTPALFSLNDFYKYWLLGLDIFMSFRKIVVLVLGTILRSRSVIPLKRVRFVR